VARAVAATVIVAAMIVGAMVIAAVALAAMVIAVAAVVALAEDSAAQWALEVLIVALMVRVAIVVLGRVPLSAVGSYHGYVYPCVPRLMIEQHLEGYMLLCPSKLL
jgi:hypothetical protein